MKSGSFGAIALLVLGVALYWAATNLGDYFPQDMAAVEEPAEESGEAVADAPDSDDDASDAAQDDMAGDDMAGDDMTGEDTAGDDMASEDATDDMADEAASTADPEDVEQLEELATENLPEEASEPGTTPTLDVIRVEPSGDVVIAGNAPEGERVGLVFNDEVVAEAEVTEEGDFVLIPDEALPAGEGTLEVVTIDEDGNTMSQADTQIAVVLPEEEADDGFLVGVLRPGEAVEVLENVAPGSDAVDVVLDETNMAEAAEEAADAAEEETVEVAAVEPAQEVEEAAPAQPAAPTPFVVVDAIELEGQRIWIAGGAVPGTIVRLYQDNSLLGEALTGEEGRFLYEGTLRDATGAVTVRADALAPGTADVIARAEVPFEMPVLASEAEEAAEETEVAAVEEDTATSEETEQAPVGSTAEEAVEETAEAATEEAAETADTDASTEDAPAREAEVASESAGDTAANTAETAEPVEETETAAPATDDRSSETTTAAEQASNEATEAATAAPAQEAPAVIATPNERVSVLDTGRVIIRRGDNLWRISRRVFGLGIRYTTIYDANRDQIRNPALIFPGQVFEVPEPATEWGEVPGIEALEPDQIPTDEDLHQ